MISNLGSEHNLSLVRLGNAKKCVFVEGDDIHILAKVQKIINPGSKFSVDQLPTVPLGGWSRFNEALGAARLFFDETNGEIKTYCILDRDYHTDEEIAAILARAEENHLTLHIWSKKEIENYLFAPRALARVAGVSADGFEYEDFCNNLFQELDKLRKDTEGAILNHLYFQDRSKDPGYYYKHEIAPLMEQQWQTLEGRLSIACGKDILSIVNEWIRDKYHRSSSMTKIIDTFTPEDIAEEMKAVIDELLSNEL